jgi:mono/diheme cytochrome c family protein
MEKFKIGGTCGTLMAGVFITCVIVGPVMADEAPKPKKELDVRSTFTSICGFCHEDSGRRAGKGPQLMNSERSDQYMFDRIKKGLPGRMAAFGSIYTDDQIWKIVKFIRSLKSDEEPKNP